MIKPNQIITGDALTELKKLPDECVHCCVTSPPYWRLRDYKVDGQLGLEKTPDEYVAGMVEVFRQVRRVLKKDGTCWINIGDSYASGKCGRDDLNAAGRARLSEFGNVGYANKDISVNTPVKIRKPPAGMKPKDLVGVPWMLAFALRADGWYLRQDIIWSKPNPMPESCQDRCTKSHEYLFLLSKSPRYYYDAFSIATDYKDKTFTAFGCESKGNDDGSGLIQSENWGKSIAVRKPKQWKMPDGWDTGDGGHGSFHRNGREKGRKASRNDDPTMGVNGKGFKGHSGNYDAEGKPIGTGKANKRSVWVIPTHRFEEAHFATFPPDLIIDCIKAGCPEGGVVLDPFMGAGTTGLVAAKLGRKYLGIELNPEYVQIAENRLKKELGLFA